MAEAQLAKSASQQVQQEVVEEAEDEAEEFDDIEKLETLGVNRGDIKKAKDGGYHTCQGLMMHTKKALTQIRGLSEAKVEKLVEAAKKMCPAAGWQSAMEFERQRARDVIKISTGAEAVNELLGGGVETRSITEIFGEYRTGKTQICLTLCVTTQMPTDMGGGAGKVAFIDTEGTFRPDRIRPIASRYNLDVNAVLDNIVHARAYTHEQQMELLTPLAAKMAEEPFKLLIMDSITANLRVDFSGRGELAERQQKLGQMMNRLKKVRPFSCLRLGLVFIDALLRPAPVCMQNPRMRISEEFNVAVVITNQVMSDPSGGAIFVSDPKKPVGGHVMAHASTIRLSLRKGKAEQRIMKVADAPNLAEAEASYAITEEGIVDYKD